MRAGPDLTASNRSRVALPSLSVIGTSSSGGLESRPSVTDTLGEDSSAGHERGDEIVLEPGGTIGRYVAIERIGGGAMGVVYAAYDPKLDRKIAVKLLHPDPPCESGTGGTAARLIREARALARLSHPNVVAVYDADILDDRVFIAMEFVDGTSLAEWMRARPRSWREVVDVFVHAGRGLAAAHAVGLVHRDFKPENVLVGRSVGSLEERTAGIGARVQVVDFGIARAPGPANDSMPPRGSVPTDESERKDPSWQRGSDRLTRTGAAVGTPAYMAPEQHLGRDVDARSDQFSFCAAMHEALYGVLPFEGSSVAALAMNVTNGTMREPPARSSVPSWLRRVIVRGLATDPDARYPSMGALLRELSHDPARRRRRVAVLGAGIFGIGLLGWTTAFDDRVADPCAALERHLVGVWDDTVRSEVERAFTATALPFASRSWETVSTRLDELTTAWVAMRREACQATHVHGEQSSDLLDRRMACLQGRLRRVSALTHLLARADAEIVASSIDAVDALPALEPCADAQALLGAEAPASGARGAALDEADAALAQAEALRTAGKYDEAEPAAADAVARARALEAGALEARALRLEAMLAFAKGRYETSERTLFTALAVAERAAADPERAAILLDLGLVLGDARERYDEADRWLQQADALLARIHAEAAQRAELDHVVGLVRTGQGRHAESIERFERALVTWRAASGDHARDLARARNALGATLDAQGRHDEALAHYEAALELLEQRVGPDHPEVAVALNNLGVSLKALGRHDEARAVYERALRLRRAALGGDHPKVAATLMNLANVLVEQRRYDEAIERFGEALAIQERALGPDDAQVGKTLYNVGVALQLAGRPVEALVRYERALAIQRAALGPDHPELAYARAGMGLALVELGREDEAIAPLEAALAARLAGEAAPVDLGEIRFALARAWVASEPSRALELAEQAAADYRSIGDVEAAANVELWSARVR